MTQPIPRTPEEQRALVEHVVSCWRDRPDVQTLSMKELRKRAKDFVALCLSNPIVL